MTDRPYGDDSPYGRASFSTADVLDSEDEDRALGLDDAEGLDSFLLNAPYSPHVVSREGLGALGVAKLLSPAGPLQSKASPFHVYSSVGPSPMKSGSRLPMSNISRTASFRDTKSESSSSRHEENVEDARYSPMSQLARELSRSVSPVLDSSNNLPASSFTDATDLKEERLRVDTSRNGLQRSESDAVVSPRRGTPRTPSSGKTLLQIALRARDKSPPGSARRSLGSSNGVAETSPSSSAARKLLETPKAPAPSWALAVESPAEARVFTFEEPAPAASSQGEAPKDVPIEMDAKFVSAELDEDPKAEPSSPPSRAARRRPGPRPAALTDWVSQMAHYKRSRNLAKFELEMSYNAKMLKKTKVLLDDLMRQIDQVRPVSESAARPELLAAHRRLVELHAAAGYESAQAALLRLDHIKARPSGWSRISSRSAARRATAPQPAPAQAPPPANEGIPPAPPALARAEAPQHVRVIHIVQNNAPDARRGFAFRLVVDFTLIAKIAFVILLFGQDASTSKLYWMAGLGALYYLMQTNGFHMPNFLRIDRGIVHMGRIPRGEVRPGILLDVWTFFSSLLLSLMPDWRPIAAAPPAPVAAAAPGAALEPPVAVVQ